MLNKPEAAKRLENCAGQDFDSRDCRVTNPHITARESIEIADYIAELEAERDALAAQVEQLREFAALILEWKEYGFEKAQELLSKTPDQCLAARDAEVKAQAVIDSIDANRNRLLTFDFNTAIRVTDLINYANQLRKQAKGDE